MSKKIELEEVVASKINHISGPRLAEFVRRAHSIAITEAIINTANHVHSLMGTHQVKGLSHRDRLILAIYQKYSHLIPDTYRDAGMQMAEHDGRKPVFYNQQTGGVYTLS